MKANPRTTKASEFVNPISTDTIETVAKCGQVFSRHSILFFFNSPLKKGETETHTHTQTHTTDTRTSTRTNERKWDILAEQTIWRYTPARRPQRNWGSNTIATRVTKRANENFFYFIFSLRGGVGGVMVGWVGGGRKWNEGERKEEEENGKGMENEGIQQ